jgi:hypothetical protein
MPAPLIPTGERCGHFPFRTPRSLPPMRSPGSHCSSQSEAHADRTRPDAFHTNVAEASNFGQRVLSESPPDDRPRNETPELRSGRPTSIAAIWPVEPIEPKRGRESGSGPGLNPLHPTSSQTFSPSMGDTRGRRVVRCSITQLLGQQGTVDLLILGDSFAPKTIHRRRGA